MVGQTRAVPTLHTVQFRPTYPQELYELVLEYAQLPRREICIDIATGQGQAAVELAKR